MNVSTEPANGAFCAPLQQLMDEHTALREAMDRFYEIAEELEYESGPAVGELFQRLYAMVSSFAGPLRAHSRREEDGLFPLMARHRGEHNRTIETMEFEHKKAEQHLQDFLSEASKAGPAIEETDAQSIAVYAVQAHATLTQHFAKEEKFVFPVAEEILTDAEKEDLRMTLLLPQSDDSHYS